MSDSSGNDYYYLHDHLYSPAVLVEDNGTVVERYEYDAYGACRVLEPNFAPDADGLSDYANSYLFTGRRLDILDANSLKIQYNRNRYYDPQTGRWLTHDPLGITPNPPKPNVFDVLGQYEDGMNLYEYVTNNPIKMLDPLGTVLEALSTEPIITGDRWLERQYFKKYSYALPRSWWDPFVTTTNTYVCWQYAALIPITINIIGPNAQGKWDEGQLAFWYRGWVWPSDSSFADKRPKDFKDNNWLCRIWVICKGTCCGDKTVDWEPKERRVTISWWWGRKTDPDARGFVYGYLRDVGVPAITLPGQKAYCDGEAIAPWSYWERALCTAEDHKRECLKSCGKN